MIKKVLTALLLSVLCLCIWPMSARGIKDFGMEIFPRKVSSSATYKFHLKIEKKLIVHEWIKLWWPKECTMPIIPTDEHEKKKELTRIIESMSIGLSPCSACQGLPTIVDNENEKSITFNSHLELWPNEEFPEKSGPEIVITVPDVVGIKNPVKPGRYTFMVATKQEPTPTRTEFEFVTSEMGVADITVNPPIYNQPAEYKIDFNVGQGGWLKGGVALLRFRFPEGTKFSKPFKDIKSSDITVNGFPVASQINGFKNAINFITPTEIKDGTKVSVIFNSKVGIINPLKPGMYQIEVSSTADPDWVLSKEYEIKKSESILKIIPFKTGKVAEYSFSFITEKPLISSDFIVVQFHPECAFLKEEFNSNDVLVNGISCFAARNSGNNKVTIHLGQKFEINDTIEIIFLKEAQIRNPMSPGKIHLSFQPKDYEKAMNTSVVEIIEQKLEIKNIEITPPNAQSLAEYIITIITGQTLNINDEIMILFSFLDTKIVSNYSPNGEEGIIKAKIKNPDPGTYTLSIVTKFKEETSSEPFVILPPLPVTQVNISGGKKGLQDWYIAPPVVGFTCNDPTATIYLYWGHKPTQVIEYDKIPKPVEDGQSQSELWFYSVSAYGKEEPQMVKLWVDTVLPEFVIENPTEDNIRINKSLIGFKGYTTSIKTVVYGTDIIKPDEILYINGKKIPVNVFEEENVKYGRFSQEIQLTEGKNEITIKAMDEAGNSKEKIYVIYSDTIPPEIKVNPIPDISLTPEVTIKGITDPEAQLTVNGEVVYVEEDGSFQAAYYCDGSKQIIKLVAIDVAGNISEKEIIFYYGYLITLQIGSNTASINDRSIIIDSPPYLNKGRTMVPFRFIGDALNAEVGYTSNSRGVDTVFYVFQGHRLVLKIGSREMIIDGIKKMIDTPPEIKKGRTFVPLRVIVDGLGCQIDWQSPTQTVVIKYPSW